jgi:hypothetical protein
MPDQPDPPRINYRFKPRAFESVNAPVGTPQEIGPINVRDLTRQAAAKGPHRSVARPANRDHDVRSLLRANLAHDNAAGLNDLTPKPRRASRRKRDYWVALILGNLALVAATIFMPVFGGAGLVIFNVGLAWIMWFVMDDY